MSNYDYKRLCPFKWFVLENFPFIEEDFDALTNWQLFCKLGKEMNKIIDSLNQMGIAVENISDYFDNLDVQEEINNKLDEMAESGELAEIINIFIANTPLTFNTVADMVASTNLTEGAKVKTYGYYSLNDNGGADYLVRAKTGEDTENGAIIFLSDENLVAEIVAKDYVNTLQFGCKNNGVNDTTTEMQNFINYLQNKEITGIVKEGTYICNSSLSITNSIHLVGENKPVIKHTALSTDTDHIAITGDNIKIENIHFRNQGHRTNIIMDNDTFAGRLISISNASNIEFNNCKFTDIYSYGVIVSYTNNIKFSECEFINATYNMLQFYQETENIFVDRCLFDGVYSSNSAGNAYLIATGVTNYDTLYNFRTKNLNITNSKFKNNLFWEGIDTHGCENCYIGNNLVENCKMGIMVVRDQRPITPCSHNNFTIENNILIGTENELTGSFAIDAGSNITQQVENFTIRNNTIKRFGYNNTNSASIILQNINNCLIDNNRVEDTFARFIITIGVTDCNIVNNSFKNVINTYDETAGYVGILIRQRSIVNFANNYMDSVNQLTAGVYSLKTIERGFVTENNNLFNNCLTNFDCFYLFEGDANADVTGKKGTYVKNQYGLITAYSTNDGFKSKTVRRGYCNATQGQNIITMTAAGGFRNLLKGDIIQVNGAGTDGANLITKVVDYDADMKIKIEDTIQTSVSNASVYTQLASWTIL